MTYYHDDKLDGMSKTFMGFGILLAVAGEIGLLYGVGWAAIKATVWACNLLGIPL